MVAKRARYVPDRGDLVWIGLDPTQGHEQQGRRPALVLSPKVYNQKAGLALMCPLTSRVKGYPFEVLVQTGGIEGVLLTDQIRSLDWRARGVEKIETASPQIVSRVQAFVKKLIID